MKYTGLTSDSRQVRTGMLFAALPGSRHDGCAFIADALANGASAILVPKGTPKPAQQVEWIESDNPRREFTRLVARYYAAQPDMMVAVTGTNGKTSTVTYVQQIWQALGYPAVSIGTVGVAGAVTHEGSMTTPDPVALHQLLAELAHKGVTHAAMEASSHGLDQYRLDGVRLKAAAFTNLTRDHLDYHGTMEAYFDAKARLFTQVLADDGVAVINIADTYGQKLRDACQALGRTIITTGGAGADLALITRTPVPTGQHVRLNIFGQSYELLFPVVGHVQIENALTALGLVIAAGKFTAASMDQLVQCLGALHAPPGRVQFVGGHPKQAGVYVDYAHTPDALAHVLADLRPHTKGRLICMFGCGGDRDPGKRPQMGAIAQAQADVVIVTDDNPRSENPAAIRTAILAACPKAQEIGDRAAAIRAAIGMANAGDVVVIAGKGHEKGQIIQGQTYPFDDVQEATHAMQEHTQ